MPGDDGVRSTSDWMASIRYRETLRPDAFLIDPCAEVLCAGSTEAADMLTRRGGPSEVVITRGWLGDRLIADAINDGLDQVVILAAGSDARAWRLGLPRSVTLFEVDLPGQHPGKPKLLGDAGFHPTCELRRVYADLRHPSWTFALQEAGFDPGRSAVWLAEGLFYYIGTDQARALIAELGFPGSRLAFDIPDERFQHVPANLGFLSFMRERGSPFIGYTGDPAAMAPGWAVQAHMSADLVVPQRLVNPAHPIWQVTAAFA